MNENTQIRVVIVDDHAIFRDGVELMLKFNPRFELVASLPNGRALFDFLKDQATDVFVLDIKEIMDLFDKLYNRRLLIRLIGVRLSGLVHGNYQISLFDDTEESIRLYQTMDRIRSKHGAGKLTRAATMEISRRIRMDNNMFAA